MNHSILSRIENIDEIEDDVQNKIITLFNNFNGIALHDGVKYVLSMVVIVYEIINLKKPISQICVTKSCEDECEDETCKDIVDIKDESELMFKFNDIIMEDDFFTKLNEFRNNDEYIKQFGKYGEKELSTYDDNFIYDYITKKL